MKTIQKMEPILKTLSFTIFIVLVFMTMIVFLLNRNIENKIVHEKCKNVHHIAYIGIKTFAYCEDTEQVWSEHDSTWVEPGTIQSQRINEYMEKSK